jgi:GTP:adenosylcobinamide-phosphate guanylyltransferase
MRYDTIILAGGKTCPSLAQVTGTDNDALIRIGDNPMIWYVYQALRKCPAVGRIVIGGPAEKLKLFFAEEKDLLFVNDGENAIETFNNAVKLLRTLGISNRLLIMPTDIPFITTEAINDFIARSEAVEADFYYAITRKEVNERKFPGVQRTYVKIKDGVFTGGNLFIINSNKIDQALSIATQLTKHRKNPLAMGRILGLSMVWNYLIRNLSIKMVEERFYKVLKIRGKAIISEYAEVGVDVDKPSDLELACNYFGYNQ